jgi:hypothetical protein
MGVPTSHNGNLMNVYEHFFWNFSLFYRKSWAWKVALGGIFPDLIYMIAFIPKIFFYRNFIEWMHDPLWDTLWGSFVARGAHSFVVWGAFLLLFLVVLYKETFRQIYPFFIGWNLHIVFDALTHVSDGYALFYPLSGYRFPAPVSYWERAYHARAYFWISHCLMAALFLLWIGWKVKRFIRKRP